MEKNLAADAVAFARTPDDIWTQFIVNARTTRRYTRTADLFPMMSEAELQALAEDIKANGLHHPVVLDAEGRVLDGRNRLAACELADVEPAFVTQEPADPVALVVSLNVKRRNLSKGQTAIAAAEAWDLASAKDGGREGRYGSLAGSFGISTGYVKQARALVERDKSGAEAVKQGATSLKEAYDDLLKREGKLRGDSEELAKLRADHPDLADAVDQEALSPQGVTFRHRPSP